MALDGVAWLISPHMVEVPGFLRSTSFRLEDARGGVFLPPNVMKEEYSQRGDEHFSDP